MTGTRRTLGEFLDHILVAIEKIERHTTNIDQARFMQNDLIQDAVIRNLEVIGEASRNVLKHYPEFSQIHPEVQLTSAYQMRNAVSHGYFSVDLDVVWRTIQDSLPKLKTQIVAAIPSFRGK